MLILDEATSALDRKNEREIQQTLNSLSEGNMTTVVVAHRLSTIRSADHIIVLGKGKILEEGTHEQLYSKEGAYFELVKSQMATSGEAEVTGGPTESKDLKSAT
jgi:ABC-type multidrug transport system fused ATPase/permease subunit